MHDLDRQQLEQYEQEATLAEASIGPLGEAQEMEAAAQFLEITTEAELEEFLGALYNRARAAVGSAATAADKAYNSDFVRKELVPTLKTAGRYFLPVAAGIGSEWISPGSGPWVTAGTKAIADKLLKEELEGLSGEDREFELARRYVRFAQDALQRALQTPPRVPPAVAGRVAIGEAARRHAPGLVPALHQIADGAPANGNGAAGGSWYRRGNSIVIDLG